MAEAAKEAGGGGVVKKVVAAVVEEVLGAPEGRGEGADLESRLAVGVRVVEEAVARRAARALAAERAAVGEHQLAQQREVVRVGGVRDIDLAGPRWEQRW